MKHRASIGRMPTDGIYLGTVEGERGTHWRITARNWTTVGPTPTPSNGDWSAVELKAWRKQRRPGSGNAQLFYIPTTGRLRRSSAAGALAERESQRMLDDICGLVAAFDHTTAEGDRSQWPVESREGPVLYKTRVDFIGNPGPSEEELEFEETFG